MISMNPTRMSKEIEEIVCDWFVAEGLVPVCYDMPDERIDRLAQALTRFVEERERKTRSEG